MIIDHFDKNQLESALTRLSDLLEKAKEPMDLVVAGGVISVLVLNNRTHTHDIDAIFPDNPEKKEILKKFIRQVSDELNLTNAKNNEWLNDDIDKTIGLETKSENIVFKNKGLTLRAASWEELTAQKLSGFRNRNDVIDGLHFLQSLQKEHPNISDSDLYKKILNHKPFIPTVKESIFLDRFNVLMDIISPDRTPNPFDLPEDFKYPNSTEPEMSF